MIGRLTERSFGGCTEGAAWHITAALWQAGRRVYAEGRSTLPPEFAAFPLACKINMLKRTRYHQQNLLGRAGNRSCCLQRRSLIVSATSCKCRHGAFFLRSRCASKARLDGSGTHQCSAPAASIFRLGVTRSSLHFMSWRFRGECLDPRQQTLLLSKHYPANQPRASTALVHDTEWPHFREHGPSSRGG